MSHDYVARLGHFKFSRDENKLVVTSERDSAFEKTYDWPSDLDEDNDIREDLHSRFYLDVQEAFEQ